MRPFSVFRNSAVFMQSTLLFPQPLCAIIMNHFFFRPLRLLSPVRFIHRSLSGSCLRVLLNERAKISQCMETKLTAKSISYPIHNRKAVTKRRSTYHRRASDEQQSHCSHQHRRRHRGYRRRAGVRAAARPRADGRTECRDRQVRRRRCCYVTTKPSQRL